MELELENKLTDNAEAQEEKDLELAQLKKDVQKYKTESTKQANNITYLRGEKDKLNAQVKKLEKMLSGEEEQDEQNNDDDDQVSNGSYHQQNENN